MLENIRVISLGRVAQIVEHLPGQQRVKVKSDSSYSFKFNEMARPGETRTPDPLLRRPIADEMRTSRCYLDLFGAE